MLISSLILSFSHSLLFNRYDVELYTIIIRHQHGHGVPVGFLVTNDKTARPIMEWLLYLCNELHVTPNYVSMDDSATELYAVNGAFPSATTFLCVWHVIKAWRDQANSKVVPFADDLVEANNEDSEDGSNRDNIQNNQTKKKKNNIDDLGKSKYTEMKSLNF